MSQRRRSRPSGWPCVRRWRPAVVPASLHQRACSGDGPQKIRTSGCPPSGPSPRFSGETPMIAIVDYGVGNLRSVEHALVHVGAEPKLTADPDDLLHADGLVLPGVGAFAPALEKLSEGGLGRWVVELAGKGKPALGGCLGYQLL